MANGFRKIIVDRTEYRWRVGKKHVEIRGPNKLKLTPLRTEFAKEAPEREYYCCDMCDGINFIGPGDIASRIRDHVIREAW
jgi:hypothetical protein